MSDIKKIALIARMNNATAQINLYTAQMNHDLQRYGEWRCDYSRAAGMAQKEFDGLYRFYHFLETGQRLEP